MLYPSTKVQILTLAVLPQLRVARVPDNLKFEPRDSLALYEAMLAAVKQGKEGEAVKARADALAQV